MAHDRPQDSPKASTQTKAGFTKVTNAHTAPLGLPPITQERVKQLGAELKGEYGEHYLEKGENDIPSDYWNIVKDQSPVRNWIEDGLLYEGPDQGAKAHFGHSHRESISSLSEEEAANHVNASSNREQLQQWLSTERRPKVREAIQRRFESLGAGR